MLKIMLISNPHPTEIIDLMQTVYGNFVMGDQRILVLSPQATALMIEEAKQIPYGSAFYPAISTVEHFRQTIKEEDYDCFIMLGTTDKKTLSWYDVVLGFQEVFEDGEPVLGIYTKFDEDFNVYKVDYMRLEDADTIIDSKRELLSFLNKLLKMERKKNDTAREE